MGFLKRLAGMALGFTTGWLCIASGGLLWGSIAAIGGSIITRELGMKYTTLGIWAGIAIRFRWVALTYGAIKLAMIAAATAEAAAELASKAAYLAWVGYAAVDLGPYPWWDATRAWEDWIGTARWAPYGTW